MTDPLIDRDELLEALSDVVGQACYVMGEDGESYLDSLALGAYARALRLLARAGVVTIDSEYGRRVIAHWTVSYD